MSNTIKFQCHIQISNIKLLDEVKGKALYFMGDSKTIDEKGRVIFDCELQERDKYKSFPITIEDEEYIVVGTGKCNVIAHQNSTNPFCLTLNKDDEANIRHIRIYKEQDKANLDEKEQIDIYTAQVEKRGEIDTPTSQTPLQENQNLIHLESHLTDGKALRKDIRWVYYVKYRNEPLWEENKIKEESLESLPFTSKAKHNTQVSFDINAKFKYTIKEEQTQKKVEDYLKEKQQLVIFAYKNKPAYQTRNGQTHIILNISTLPIVEVTSKTIKILYASTNATYNLTQSCDTHYLNENLNKDKVYILQLTESSLHIKDKENNKDIALILTKEISYLQEKQILLDSQNFQTLQNVLNLHRQKDNTEVYVEVKLSRWDRIKIAYQRIDNLGKSEQDPVQKAKPKYELIGGEPYDKFKNAPHTYENTCALRMSYALNYGGIPIQPTPDTKILIGGDKKLYVLGSQDIRNFLYVKWKYQKPYNPKYMDSKQENQSFYQDELLQFKKNGIVVMRIDGWGESAYGHATLWDGKDKKFVDDSNYLLDDRDKVIVRQFYFWELE